MTGDDDLWKTGKSSSESQDEIKEEKDTLDLSGPSPDTDELEEEINLNENGEDEGDNWAVPVVEEDIGIDVKTIGVVGTVVILLLTGTLFVLLNEPNIEISVPYEKYESSVDYDVEGYINFESDLDIPIPIGFIDNDIIINELKVNFQGELNAAIKAPSEQKKDGYGILRNVFNKSLVQNLDDIDGSIKDNSMLSATTIQNAQVKTHQYKYIDDTSLEIIRSDLQSNASYSDTLTGKTWYWQSATDWIPRMSDTGLLPHGEAYIGKTLKQGTKGVTNEGGIEFNWKVDNGGKINNEQTALLKIHTSYTSDPVLGYEYQYQYNFNLYMSEISSFPLQFEMTFSSEASSPGGKLYAISVQYNATSKNIVVGSQENVPTTAHGSNSAVKTGEFKKWVDGAPAFGNETCGLDANFTIQNGIEKGKNNISKFKNYIDFQEDDGKAAFVTNASYSIAEDSEKEWEFTMAYRNPQSTDVKGWNLNYNQTNISGENITVNNPIMSMDDIEKPLTICSAENVMTDFDEIANWANNKQTNNVNYSKAKLRLGQNLVSQQSLSSPTSVIDIGNLDPIKIFSALSDGSLNLDDYSGNIDVETAGSYAYFLDKKGGSEELGYEYQELAGVDAKDGLVLFNLQSRNSA